MKKFEQLLKNKYGAFALEYVKEQDAKSLADFLRQRINPSSTDLKELEDYLGRNELYVPVAYNSFADLVIEGGKIGNTTNTYTMEWYYSIHDLQEVSEVWFASCYGNAIWIWRKTEKGFLRAKYVQLDCLLCETPLESAAVKESALSPT
jgi:hypothetical protein